MGNFMLVEVLHSKAQLVEEKLDSRLWQEASGNQPLKQLPATCYLHDDKHFLWSFYGVKKLDDAWLGGRTVLKGGVIITHTHTHTHEHTHTHTHNFF